MVWSCLKHLELSDWGGKTLAVANGVLLVLGSLGLAGVDHSEDGLVGHQAHLLHLVDGLNSEDVVLALHLLGRLQLVGSSSVRSLDAQGRALAVLL